MILEELSEVRRARVEELSLETAVSVLRTKERTLMKRARKSGVLPEPLERQADAIVRVLAELERREPADPEPAGPSTIDVTLQLVEPDQRNPTAEHVLNPRGPNGSPITLCGYRADDWIFRAEVTWARAEELLEYPNLCERCRTSLKTRLGGH